VAARLDEQRSLICINPDHRPVAILALYFERTALKFALSGEYWELPAQGDQDEILDRIIRAACRWLRNSWYGTGWCRGLLPICRLPCWLHREGGCGASSTARRARGGDPRGRRAWNAQESRRSGGSRRSPLIGSFARIALFRRRGSLGSGQSGYLPQQDRARVRLEGPRSATLVCGDFHQDSRFRCRAAERTDRRRNHTNGLASLFMEGPTSTNACQCLPGAATDASRAIFFARWRNIARTAFLFWMHIFRNRRLRTGPARVRTSSVFIPIGNGRSALLTIRASRQSFPCRSRARRSAPTPRQ